MANGPQLGIQNRFTARRHLLKVRNQANKNQAPDRTYKYPHAGAAKWGMRTQLLKQH